MSDHSEISSNSFRLYATCALIILVWGTAYTMIGYIVDYIAPAWIASYRTALAAIVVTGYMLARGRRFPPLNDKAWRSYIILGFLGIAGPFYLIARGQMNVESGLAGILAGFMPLITIVLAHFLIKGERLNFRKFIGFILGFIGIVILFLPDNLSFELVKNWPSQLLIVLAAAFYASATIVAKRAPPVAPSVGAAMMVSAGAVMSFVFACFTGFPTSVPPTSALLAIAGLAIGSTGVANILFLRLVQETGPSFVARINYLVPICSLIAGIIFLGEPFQWRSVIAMAVVISGLIIAGSANKTVISNPSTPQKD